MSLGMLAGAVSLPPAFAGPRDKELKQEKNKVDAKVEGAHDDLEHSSAALQQATAALSAAQAQLDTAQAHLAKTRGELAAAEALDRQMQAKLDAAIAKLQKARADLEAGHVKVAEQEQELGRIVVANYQTGDPALMGLSMVLTSQDPSELSGSPGRALKAYGDTYVELKSAIITVMAVLALAFVMNLSGQTTSLGLWLAGAGGAFAILSPILGWIGVAVTGSDTSSNALFGALQVQTAKEAGLDEVLMAAANSSGGVLGKMISPQNLAIAAAAVGMAGREGDIFRKVIGWSLVLLVLMCVIVALQATPVLGWMVP